MSPPLSDRMKAQCVLWMHETKSATLVRRKCRVEFKMKKGIPSRSTILSWYSNFLETGHIMSQVKKGRKEIDNDVVQTLSELFEESPKTPIRVAARSVPVCKSSVHNIVRKKLKLYPYKIQLVQALKPDDYGKREEFARTILRRVEDDPDYLERVFFTDEATFHVSGLVHRHNVRIWGKENPRIVQEVERNSPKLNVWCGLFHDQVIGPFFEEETIRQDNFLAMLNEFAYPQIRQRQRHI